MNGEESQSHRLRDVILAILLGILTYGGLAVATGKVPGIELPEEVTVPVYVLLYSFLGGVAYLLSALLGEYTEVGKKEKKLVRLENVLEKKKETLEKGKVEAEKMDLKLQKVKGRLQLLREDKLKAMNLWIKLARIPFGMLTATVVFLLVGKLLSPDLVDAMGPEILAGISFVVALFPKVIMEGLNAFALRLMGK